MRRYRIAAVVAGAALTVAACTEKQAGPRELGIHFLDGAGLTDTISAPSPRLLRVAVSDGSGEAIKGATVVFSSMVYTGSGTAGPVLIGSATGTTVSTFYVDSTGADGTVSVRTTLGDVAGKGAIIVNVPSLQLVDTAEYTILAGRPNYITVLPEDSTIAVGKTLTIRPRVIDRMGNVRNDLPAYRLVSPKVSVSAAGVVSVAQPARLTVIASIPNPGGPIIEDTTFVTAIPDFTVLVRRANALATMQLDGSNYNEIPLGFLVVEPGPRWAPDGQSILATVKTQITERLYGQRVALNGSTTPIIVPQSTADSLGAVNVFEYSPDKQWIYFTSNNCNINSILYRVPASGGAPVRLSPAATFPDECFSVIFKFPSLSPDGTQLAYENTTSFEAGYNIRTLDIATRTVRVLNVVGRQPRWSPVSNQIAFWNNDRIWTMDANGTNVRAITPANRMYAPGQSWSRDGQWIVARYQARQGNSSLTTVLLNVATGLELPMAHFNFPSNYSLPDFKPVP